VRAETCNLFLPKVLTGRCGRANALIQPLSARSVASVIQIGTPGTRSGRVRQ